MEKIPLPDYEAVPLDDIAVTLLLSNLFLKRIESKYPLSAKEQW